MNVVAPLSAACFQRIYPEAAAQVDVQSATKALQEVIQTWEREQVQQPGECCQILHTEDMSDCYQACPPRLGAWEATLNITDTLLLSNMQTLRFENWPDATWRVSESHAVQACCWAIHSFPGFLP